MNEAPDHNMTPTELIEHILRLVRSNDFECLVLGRMRLAKELAKAALADQLADAVLAQEEKRRDFVDGLITLENRESWDQLLALARKIKEG